MGDSTPELMLSAPDGFGFSYGWVYMMVNGKPKLIAHDYGAECFGYSSAQRTISYCETRGNYREYQFKAYDSKGNVSRSFLDNMK